LLAASTEGASRLQVSQVGAQHHNTVGVPATPAGVAEVLRVTAPLVGGGSFDGATVAGTPTVFWFWAPT